MIRRHGCRSIADLVIIVADRQHLGRSNVSKRLSAVWVTKHDDSRDLCSVRRRRLQGGFVHELGALRVAGEDDLRAWAAGCSLTFSQDESITCIYVVGYILTVEIKLAMVLAPVASPPARNPAMLAG